MRPRVSRQFRDAVHEIVRLGYVPERSNIIAPTFRLPSNSSLLDVSYFHLQTREIRVNSTSQYAAFFHEAEFDGDSFPVLVQVPDLDNFNASYEYLLLSLEKAKFKLEQVAPPQATEIFVDRLAEFLSVEVTAGSTPIRANTIVNSNRHGDTVIYAKGYFVSTGTAFGLSTPAQRYLAPGRYSFGIMDSGQPKFQNVVWNCPTTVRLDLP